MSEASGPRPAVSAASPEASQTSTAAGTPHAVPTELLRALAHLCEPPGPAHAALADALGLPEPPDAAGHEALFGFQLYPWASVYLGAEGMLGGEAQRRVEGFWRAVGREPPGEPDHLASLLGLYVALAEEESEVRGEADRGAEPRAGATSRTASAARAELVARSRRALLEEHLAPWVFAFLDRVTETGGAFHRGWADLLHALLQDEAQAGGRLDRRPSFLAELPALADPREEGAGPFIRGLLAPAVSGIVFTRADLAAAAHQLGLGLRAGERRYALEHLLGQDAPPVLDALANEAGRQAHAHGRRAEALGTAVGWATERAHGTEELLRVLSSTSREASSATPARRGS